MVWGGIVLDDPPFLVGRAPREMIFWESASPSCTLLVLFGKAFFFPFYFDCTNIILIFTVLFGKQVSLSLSIQFIIVYKIYLNLVFLL